MFQLQSLSIAKRLALLIGSALLGTLLLAAVLLLSERQIILKERQSSVRENVEVAHGLLVHFQSLAARGVLGDDEARRQALAAIKALRYGGSEYFWINDMQVRMVMHPVKPELDGKDMSGNLDPAGNRPFVMFVDTVKASGAGFVDYMWPKAGSEKPVHKVSFVKGFAPWGWVVGSGVYLDTVDATMAERAIGVGLGTAALAALLLAFGFVVSRGMLGQLGGEPAAAADITRRMAAGDLGVEIALRAGDQTSLLHSIKTLRDSLCGIVGRVASGRNR